jgi:hypothetical protein
VRGPTAASGEEGEQDTSEESESFHGKSAICSGILTLPGARPV